jgi:hypothetical protein
LALKNVTIGGEDLCPQAIERYEPQGASFFRMIKSNKTALLLLLSDK